MVLALSGCSLALAQRDAQAQAFNPATLDPGLQQQQQLQDQQLERRPQVEREEPKPLFSEEEPTGPAPGAADPELLINQVRFEGNTVIPSAELEVPFTPLLGRPIRFAEQEQAINAGSNLYRDRGYFTSRLVLPEAGLRDGVLTVIALEGYLETVEVSGKGSEAFRGWVRRYLAPVIAVPNAPRPAPIRFDQLERQLLLLQAVSGVRYGATLAPGQADRKSVV
jgi:hemolysin activation/secretion protein